MNSEDLNPKKPEQSLSDTEAPKAVEAWSTPVPDADQAPSDLSYTPLKDAQEVSKMPNPVEAWEETIAVNSSKSDDNETDEVSQSQAESFPPAIAVWEIPGDPSET